MTATAYTNRRVVLAACPLCEGTDATTIADGESDALAETEWVRCTCSLVFKRSEAVEVQHAAHESLGDLGEPHGADVAHYDEAYFDRYDRRRRRRIAKSRRQIRDALEVAPPGPLLDVGCSLGYAMEAARGLGLRVAGVDLAPRALEHCRRLGFDARGGTLEELPFGDASFAAVILKHVFEHTAAPREALAELRRVTIPGAALFFAVPNAGYFKAARSPATSRFFRGEAGRAHQIYWSPATLSRLLGQEGFVVANVHPRLTHRRGPLALRAAELVALPLRLLLRLAADAFGLRKEFWLVAVRG